MIELKNKDLNVDATLPKIFNELSKGQEIDQVPIISIMVAQGNDKIEIQLEMFSDRLVKRSGSKTSYILLNDEIFFDYDYGGNSILLQKKQTAQKQVFNSSNSIELKNFINQLKRVCPQQEFTKKFEIVEEEGKGYNSCVYTVKRKLDQAIFAAKKKQKYGYAMMREIQTLRALDHPNLIYFREFFIQKDNTAYIIMDYEDGGSLIDILLSKNQISTKQKFKIITDMLNALEFLRIKDIVHRDLKPENILYSKKDGNYKIGDFGLSRRAGQKLDIISGTPGYIAPEFFTIKNSSLILNTSSDIYSMGLIFYQIITSKQYYEGKNNQQILKCNMQKQSLRKKKNTGHKITKIEYKILQSMIQSDPKCRKNSCQILQSSCFAKINKKVSLDFSNSDTTSPSKMSSASKSGSKSGSDGEEIQGNLMRSFIDLLRMRSWSS